MKLPNGKIITKPHVKIIDGKWCVLCRDTFKATAHETRYEPFAYVWCVRPTMLLRSLSSYLMMTGIQT